MDMLCYCCCLNVSYIQGKTVVTLEHVISCLLQHWNVLRVTVYRGMSVHIHSYPSHIRFIPIWNSPLSGCPTESNKVIWSCGYLEFPSISRWHPGTTKIIWSNLATIELQQYIVLQYTSMYSKVVVVQVLQYCSTTVLHITHP